MLVNGGKVLATLTVHPEVFGGCHRNLHGSFKFPLSTDLLKSDQTITVTSKFITTIDRIIGNPVCYFLYSHTVSWCPIYGEKFLPLPHLCNFCRIHAPSVLEMCISYEWHSKSRRQTFLLHSFTANVKPLEHFVKMSAAVVNHFCLTVAWFSGGLVMLSWLPSISLIKLKTNCRTIFEKKDNSIGKYNTDRLVCRWVWWKKPRPTCCDKTARMSTFPLKTIRLLKAVFLH